MSNGITVFYKWTAKPGKLEELKGIYQNVVDQMNNNEPDALKVQVSVSKNEDSIYIVDVFKDANALGLHLSQTAAAHFQHLLEIATPGTFNFVGDVPEELVGAINGMGLPAEFTANDFGFVR
jgi:quinol monooxygenase YgiN